MKAPYGYWCDSYGCKMLILKARDDGFDIVNAIEPVREPVYLGHYSPNTWREIIMRISGWWGVKTKNVVLRYDGRQYPKNPQDLPADNIDVNSLELIFGR